MAKTRVLFILKRNNYGYEAVGDGAGGLLNSTQFIVDMLKAKGVCASIVVVTDNNDIDREVTRFRPDIVVIEALWVVPEKFDILSQLHPKVRWVVRIHSDFPFLASEGIAIDWIFKYLDREVFVAFNKKRSAGDFVAMTHDTRVLYLPNFYPLGNIKQNPLDVGVHIGCFGAVRPLKNQLTQAVAAIEYAERAAETLYFHMNGTRTEQGGASVLANIVALFANTKHKLILHPWLDHDAFLALLARMDLAMAVSFSETFCITAADAVNVGLPLVCSDQVPFADSRSIVSTTDTVAMAQRIDSLVGGGLVSKFLNRRNLANYSAKSRKIWLNTLDTIKPE